MDLLNDLIFEVEASLAASDVSTVSGGGQKKPQPASKKPSPSSSSAPASNPPVAPSQASAAAPASATPSEKAPVTVNSLDLRVGLIRTCKKHETAEKLYCEEIDVGESEPRQIASGLVPHYSLEEMTGRRIIVVCNLKPRNLVGKYYYHAIAFWMFYTNFMVVVVSISFTGFKSNGMVLCAVHKLEDGSEKVEFVDPPSEAAVGDRISGEGLTGTTLSASQVRTQCYFL